MKNNLLTDTPSDLNSEKVSGIVALYEKLTSEKHIIIKQTEDILQLLADNETNIHVYLPDFNISDQEPSYENHIIIHHATSDTVTFSNPVKRWQEISPVVLNDDGTESITLDLFKKLFEAGGRAIIGQKS